jgi:hypothetical protein
MRALPAIIFSRCSRIIGWSGLGLLTCSIAANTVLIAYLMSRPAPPAPADRRMTVAAVRSATAVADQGAAQQRAALLAALAAGDSAAMLAAGVAPDVVRMLAAARAFRRWATSAGQVEQAVDGNPTEYWRRSPKRLHPPRSREQRVTAHQAEREFDSAMREAFGSAWTGYMGRQRDNTGLSAVRKEQLQKIERDYEELESELQDEAYDFQLSGDLAKQRLLQAEKKRDLDAALTPAEHEQVELRTSESAERVITAYGDIITSEAEYLRLYAVQKAYDVRFSNEDYYARTPGWEKDPARIEAEHQLNDEIRAILGNDRWGASSREDDQEYERLTRLTARLNLPVSAADQVYLVRDAYAAQSLAINQNAMLGAAERKAQLNDLAKHAEGELQWRLGAEGAKAYAGRASWLSMLRNGQAFTTDARLLPPGSGRPGAGSAFALPAPRLPSSR